MFPECYINPCILKDDIGQRLNQDEFTLNCIELGESKMEELDRKLKDIQTYHRDALSLGTFYKKLIRVCEKNPVSNEIWVEILEKKMLALSLEIDVRMNQKNTCDIEESKLKVIFIIYLFFTTILMILKIN